MCGAFASPTLRSLEPDAVHVWEIDLVACSDLLESLSGVLSEFERERAARFAFDRLRQSYAISHGAARMVLSSYVGVEPQALEFLTGEHGKPSLHPRHDSDIGFNLSHSGTKCLVAVTRGREVGVDVERMRPLDDWLEIARRFFSDAETSQLLRLTETLRRDGFFATWSRKEAYIKAIGMGLALELGSFTVEADPRSEARLLWVRGAEEEPKHWNMRTVVVDPEYHAALAVRGKCVLTTFKWSALVP